METIANKASLNSRCRSAKIEGEAYTERLEPKHRVFRGIDVAEQ